LTMAICLPFGLVITRLRIDRYIKPTIIIGAKFQLLLVTTSCNTNEICK
jgi:hypothetical protein